MTDLDRDLVRAWCGDDRAIEKTLESVLRQAKTLNTSPGELLPQAVFILLKQAYAAGVDRVQTEVCGALEAAAKRATLTFTAEVKTGRARIMSECDQIKTYTLEGK
jgi:hypothetical protein